MSNDLKAKSLRAMSATFLFEALGLGCAYALHCLGWL